MIDPGVATVIAAVVLSIPGVVAAVLAVLGRRDLHTIKTQTNHMQEVMQAQATKIGVAEGIKQEKDNPTT